VIPLQVAGAFHTAHMSPAVDALAVAAQGIAPRAPGTRLLSNADGAVVSDGGHVLQRLVAQVSNPVRWDLCQQTLADLGVTAAVELAPGGALAGLAKRALRGVTVVALKTPDDLDAARALIEEHASQPPAAAAGESRTHSASTQGGPA
jgi:[acyl-carrier-protein] S-malonyltransferase